MQARCRPCGDGMEKAAALRHGPPVGADHRRLRPRQSQRSSWVNLQRLGTFLASASVDAAENALRQLAHWMITEAWLTAVGEFGRDDIEDYKVRLAARP